MTALSTLKFGGVSTVTAYTGTSAAMATPTTRNGDIRVVCTSDAWITIGSAPVATAGADSLYMPAGVVEYFTVPAGVKVAAIQNSAGGSLNVAEMIE